MQKLSFISDQLPPTNITSMSVVRKMEIQLALPNLHFPRLLPSFVHMSACVFYGSWILLRGPPFGACSPGTKARGVQLALAAKMTRATGGLVQKSQPHSLPNKRQPLRLSRSCFAYA